jgi:hypothetical protein
MSERRPATTIGELDIHLSHVMDAITRLNDRVDRLATTDWVTEQLRERDARLTNLAGQIQGASVTTRLKRAAEIVQQVSIIVGCIGALGAFIVAAVHYSDKLP